jgi:hypothetical protein
LDAGADPFREDLFGEYDLYGVSFKRLPLTTL